MKESLADILGQPLSVADFIEDAELLQQGLPPKHVRIGMKFTQFQELKDEETKNVKTKQRANAFKMEMEANLRMAQEIRDKKKKQQEVYERLEQDLTLFELQEDRHFKQLIDESSQQNDLGSNVYSYSNDKGEIRIADQNIFNEKMNEQRMSGPEMYSQDNDDDIDMKYKGINERLS